MAGTAGTDVGSAAGVTAGAPDVRAPSAGVAPPAGGGQAQPPAGGSAAGAGGNSAGDGPLPGFTPELSDGIEEVEATEPGTEALVDRPPVGGYACNVVRPVEELPIGMASTAMAAGTAPGGSARLFWNEASTALGPFDGPIRTARVGTDGVLGAITTVFTPSPGDGVSPTGHVVVGSDRVTFWWDYTAANEATPLPVADAPLAASLVDPSSGLVQLDADGSALAPARPFDLAQFAFDAHVVESRNGYLAAWGEHSQTECAIVIARLDATASQVGEHVTLVPLPIPAGVPIGDRCRVVDLIETPTGLALVYSRTEIASPLLTREVHAYQAFGDDDEPLAPATRLTSLDGFAVHAQLALAGNDVLVAYGLRVGGSLFGGEHTLRVARFGPDGVEVSPPVLVEHPAAARFDGGQLWVELDDALGLSWNRTRFVDSGCDPGTQGCLARGEVQLLVLDGSDLSPHGPPTSLTVEGSDQPGIDASLLARTGDDLLVLGQRWTQQLGDFGWARLSGRAASATLHCSR